MLGQWEGRDAVQSLERLCAEEHGRTTTGRKSSRLTVSWKGSFGWLASAGCCGGSFLDDAAGLCDGIPLNMSSSIWSACVVNNEC
jgi:hypothetical protein